MALVASQQHPSRRRRLAVIAAILAILLVIAGFAGAVAIGFLAIGPLVMTALLGNHGFQYNRFGLAVVGLGMGLHLAAGTLNQAALARGRARLASLAWEEGRALVLVSHDESDVAAVAGDAVVPHEPEAAAATPGGDSRGEPARRRRQ